MLQYSIVLLRSEWSKCGALGTIGPILTRRLRLWCVVCGVWCVVCGVWCVGRGRNESSIARELHTIECTLRHPIALTSGCRARRRIARPIVCVATVTAAIGIGVLSRCAVADLTLEYTSIGLAITLGEVFQRRAAAQGGTPKWLSPYLYKQLTSLSSIARRHKPTLAM